MANLKQKYLLIKFVLLACVYVFGNKHIDKIIGASQTEFCAGFKLYDCLK